MNRVNKKKVINHLKGDIKTFEHEKKEDQELIRSIKKRKKKPARK